MKNSNSILDSLNILETINLTLMKSVNEGQINNESDLTCFILTMAKMTGLDADVIKDVVVSIANRLKLNL